MNFFEILSAIWGLVLLMIFMLSPLILPLVIDFLCKVIKAIKVYLEEGINQYDSNGDYVHP